MFCLKTEGTFTEIVVGGHISKLICFCIYGDVQTPWSRALMEKQTIAQLDKKFPTFNVI
jgi:hypothetical protein